MAHALQDASPQERAQTVARTSIQRVHIAAVPAWMNRRLFDRYNAEFGQLITFQIGVK